jgi:hypothetical protein
MSADAYYDVLGTPFRVRSDNDELAAAFDSIVGMFRSEPGDADSEIRFWITERADHPDHYDVYRQRPGRKRKVKWEDIHGDRVLMRMIVQLNSGGIRGAHHFAAHSGVVAADGVAIAYPASSGAGKSTLSAALLMDGFTYVSDEALVLDGETGMVIPYAKTLWISTWSVEHLNITNEQIVFASDRYKDVMVTAASLGGKSAVDLLPLGHVIDFEVREGPAEIRPLPVGTAGALLLNHAFNPERESRAVFELIANVARRVRSWRLSYSDPLDAVSLIRSIQDE